MEAGQTAGPVARAAVGTLAAALGLAVVLAFFAGAGSGVPTPVVMTDVCVNNANGNLYFPVGDATPTVDPIVCAPSQTAKAVDDPNAILQTCYLNSNGATRELKSGGQCASAPRSKKETPLAVPSLTTDLYFCANTSDGALFFKGTSPVGCKSGQFLVVVERGNTPPTASPQSVTVTEDTPKEITLSASDPDDQDLTFGIVAGQGPSHGSLSALGSPDCSAVNTCTATVTYTPSPDYSGPDSFQFRANDGFGDSAPATVSITVTNVNDTPTDIALSNASVNENVSTGTTVGTLSTTDADPGDTHTYSLPASGCSGSYPDGAAFQVDGSSLETAAALDHETKSSYSICVRVTDSGSPAASYDEVFTIGVNNVNDAPTDIALSDTSVDENQPAGTAVGTLSTSDQDTGDTHTYALVAGTGDTGNGSFAVDGTTLKTAAVLDYEAQSSYSIRVRVTDSGTPAASYDEVFTISVGNLNDPPTDIALSNASVDENQVSGTAVGTLSTTDEDGGTHAYSLVAGTGDTGNGSFTVDGATLKTAAVFDYESQSSYSIRVRSDDGSGGTFEKAFTISVSDLNDPPVLANIESAALAYTAGDPAVEITSTLTVSDQDDAQLTGATVSITANFSSGDDVLSFTDTAAITGSYSASTGVLTLSGTASLANYQAALRSVKYSTADASPASTATRTVSFQAGDGSALSNVAARNVAVSLPNQPPTADAQSVTTGEDTAKLISLTGSDPEDANLTFSIVDAPANGGLGTIGTPDCSALNTCSASVTYTPGANYNGADSFTFKVNDGSLDSTAATVSITITAVNDAPVLANAESAALGYTENAAATAITSTLTVSDVDSASLTGATVSITSGYQSGADVLAFANTATITGSFNAATGVLTLSGSDTLASYQAALRAVTYANTSDDPSTATRTVSFQANDGAAADNLSNTATRDVAVTAVNDAPVLAALETAALSYTEGKNTDPTPVPELAVTATITASDVDSASLASGTVAISANYVSGQDVLTYTQPGGNPITGSFNAGSGVLTLTGPGTVAQMQAALRAVSYKNTSDTPNTILTRTLTFQVGDGTDTSNSPTRDLTVTATNDAPVGATTASHAVTGNVRIQVAAPALLSGVTDPESDAIAAQLDGSNASLGNATVNANGSYAYNPKAGREGADTVKWKVCDNGTPSECTAVQNLNLNVSGMLWFVNAAAASGGSGRLTDPFNSLAFTNDGAGDNPAANETLFVYSGSYTGPLALLNGQKLVGQGASASLTTISGITPAADSDPLPSTGGTAPALTNASGNVVQLGQNNTVRGIAIGNRSGIGLSGSAFGTLTVATDVSITGTGQAIFLNNGTLSGSFDTVSGTSSTTSGITLQSLGGAFAASGGSISTSGSATAGILVDGGTANVTYPGAITSSAGNSVKIQNKTGGTVTLSGAINDTGSGISLTSNSGATMSFSGGITASTGANAAFTATGPGPAATSGGTVSVTGSGNTLTTTTGRALNVANTTIGASGLTFRSISSNGAVNGIVLNNTGSSGGLTVTGNSAGICGGSVGSGPPASQATATAPDAADCTGGVIQNSTGAGISLAGTSNVSLTRIRVAGSGGDGIGATNVTGFTLANSLVEGNGNAVDEANVDFGELASTSPDGLHGTGAITNSTVRNAFEHNVAVRNSGGAALTALTVTGSQFSNVSANAGSDDGIQFEAGGTANMTISVTGSYFEANRGDHFQAAALNSGSVNATFKNNTLKGGHAEALGQGITINAATGVAFGGYTGRIDYDVDGNNIQGAISNAVITNLGTSGSAGVLDGFIRNNVIGATGVALSCSTQANGIEIDAHGNGTHNVSVAGNIVKRCFDRGLLVLANDGHGALNLTVSSNTINELADTNATTGTPREAFNLVAGSTATSVFGQIDSHAVCLSLASTSGNMVGGAFKTGDIRVRQRFRTSIRLPGYAGSVFDTTAVVNHLQASNPGATATATSNDDPAVTTDGYFGGAACTTPS